MSLGLYIFCQNEADYKDSLSKNLAPVDICHKANLKPETQGALRFSTLQFSTREDYLVQGHFFCRILNMGLGVLVFSVLVVSPIGSFDAIG